MQTQFKIRSALVFLLFCSLYAIIVVNLYCIQIKQRDFYANLGTKQYNLTITQPAPRAIILDRTGKALALNKDALSAFIMPRLLKEPEGLKSFLQKQYPKAYRRLLNKPDAHFLFVQRNLSAQEQEEITKSNLVDLHLLKEPSRYYPIKAAGPVVGLTDIDNNGLFGIELMYDTQLAGAPITYTLEKDARSGHFYFDKHIMQEGYSGTPIQLTIDSNLQFLVYEQVKNTVEQFKATSGAALVMDPTTGEILAAVQYPTFDPSNTKELQLEHTKLHVATNTYELGSVIKTFLAMAALEEGVVTPDEIIDCEGARTTYIEGMKINTVFANDTIPFAQVIQKSNNIGVAKVALRLGDKLYGHYQKLGFGTKTGINFHGEQTGFINPPENWSNRSILSLSFGYEITASLLQLAQAFGVIANDGIMVQPKLVKSDTTAPSAHPLYSSETIAQIRDILTQTAQLATRQLRFVPNLAVMGKTGTANLVIDGHYVPDRNIYTFAGILEKGDYKRVIITFVKESERKGVLATHVAAPLFVRIAQQVLIHDNMA